MLDSCTRRFEHFCRTYRAEPKRQKCSPWGAWHLWYDIPPKGRGQADLFDDDAGRRDEGGARYRGEHGGRATRKAPCL